MIKRYYKVSRGGKNGFGSEFIVLKYIHIFYVHLGS